MNVKALAASGSFGMRERLLSKAMNDQSWDESEQESGIIIIRCCPFLRKGQESI